MKPLLLAAEYHEDLRTCEIEKRTIDNTKNTIKLLNTYSGTVTTSSPSYYDSVDIEHNLGYQPYIEVYFKLDSETVWRKAPSLDYNTSTFSTDHEVSITRTDNNEFKVIFSSGDIFGGTARTFTYFIRVTLNAWEGNWYV